MQKITPFLWFDGKAGEAAKFYCPIFNEMDSGREHPFSLTAAISRFVRWETQREIDYFWEKLSAGGNEGRCGWLKDKFGVSFK